MIENLLGFLLYFAPTIVGLIQHRPNWKQVLLFNLLLGWTVVGWFFAWVLVFPAAQLAFQRFIVRIAGSRAGAPAGGAGAPPNWDQAGGGSSMRTCSSCGGSGKQTCSSCGGRGSWYEQPQTATGTAQLVNCPACISSGKVTCMTCSGSGRLNY